MTEAVVMQCGHSSNDVDDRSRPICTLCRGFILGWNTIDTNSPILTGRIARCIKCGKKEPSSFSSLSLFRHVPEQSYDDFYCGCEEERNEKTRPRDD